MLSDEYGEYDGECENKEISEKASWPPPKQFWTSNSSFIPLR